MRKLSLLFLFLVLGLMARSEERTQSEALEIAKSFFGNLSKAKGLPFAGSSQNLKQAYTAESADGSKSFYVFNVESDNGFVIVAADDRVNDILGYSDEGRFDYSSMPENAKYWLSKYTDEIAYMKTKGINGSSTTCTQNYGEGVKPLLGAIQWNQDSPYNDLCPDYTISEKCATGCVATAMAQIMYYNRWPEVGVGSHTYSPSILNGGTLTADFGNTYYDWDNMLPVYDSQSSEESREAVALLMLHCGISVDMVYSSSSGATSISIPQALTTYFNYDQGIAYRQRDNYSSQEWQNIIIDEIDNGRPILATGVASAGGHAFVFDGYDSNGLVHVNWGWGGTSNGYFLTTVLTPATQGIGGADGGFNYNQQIITGIQKPTGNTDTDVELVSTEGLVPERNTVANGADFDIALAGTIYNAGWQDATYVYGLMLMDENNDTVLVVNTNEQNELYVNYMMEGPEFEDVNLGVLADGEYTLYPVCRAADAKGAWIRIRDEYVGYPNYLFVTVSGDRMTFRSADYFALDVQDIQLPEEIYAGIPAQVKATIVNNGDADYLGDVCVSLVNKTTRRSVAMGTTVKIDLHKGASIDVAFADAFDVEAGDYYITIVDDDESRICDLQEVSILAAPTETVVEMAEQLAFEDNNNVDKENVEVTAKIKCTQGVFGGYAYLFILNSAGTTQQTCLEPQYFFVKEGETVDVAFDGPFEDGKTGVTYMARLAIYDGTNYQLLYPSGLASCLFSLSGTSTGIDGLESDNNNGNTIIYDINGRRMQETNVNNLSNGLYIISNGSSMKKIIK